MTDETYASSSGPSFDTGFDEQLIAPPIRFQLRREEFHAVPELSQTALEKITLDQAEGRLTNLGFFDLVLLEDDDRARFRRICGERVNPVKNKTIKEIADYLMGRYQGTAPGKPNA